MRIKLILNNLSISERPVQLYSFASVKAVQGNIT